MPSRRQLDAFVERLARLLAHVFFRKVELEGREHIPVGAPLVVVANHHNSLVDPLLLFATLGVHPRFLAKNTLWQLPGIRHLLDLAGAVPVYRRQDEGVAGGEPAGPDSEARPAPGDHGERSRARDAAREPTTEPRPAQRAHGERSRARDAAHEPTTEPRPAQRAHGERSRHMAQNDATFRRCFDELAGGGAIALFPEGISHDAPGLARLKTGAARIVLGAMRERGTRTVRVLPVGLTFDAKGVFRSRVLVRVGEPIDPTPWLRAAEHDAHEATRSLTTAIARALARVTLNHPSHEEATLLERASELFAAREKELPARLALAEAFALRHAAARIYERLRARDPARVEAVRARLAGYASRIEALGLRDDQVVARYPHRQVLAYALGSLALLLWWLPLAALGTCFNWIPYRLLGFAAGRARSRDMPATVKLFGGFFLFPIAWALWSVLAGVLFGAAAAAATLVLAPATGWYAMRFQERYEHLFDEAAAWLRMRLSPRRVAALRAEREALRDEMSELARLANQTDDEKREQ